MKKQDKKQAALVDDNEFTGSKTRKHENLSSKNGKKGLIFTTLGFSELEKILPLDDVL